MSSVFSEEVRENRELMGMSESNYEDIPRPFQRIIDTLIDKGVAVAPMDAPLHHLSDDAREKATGKLTVKEVGGTGDWGWRIDYGTGGVSADYWDGYEEIGDQVDFMLRPIKGVQYKYNRGSGIKIKITEEADF